MSIRITGNPVALIVAVLTACVGPWAATGESYLSPLALAVNGETVYVAEHTANAIAVFDTSTNTVSRTITLPEAPTGLVLSPDGDKLYVTCGGPAGRVCAVNLGDGAIVAEYPAGHTPGAPVIAPDGRTLFICNRFNDNVTVIDLAGAAEPVSIPVSREPVAAALTPDGSRLLVANLLPATRADGDYVSAVVDVIDATEKKHARVIKLPNGSSSLLGIGLSPGGEYAYVTHILSRYQLPTTQLERGWVNTNALSIIDVARMELINTVLLDDVDLGAANPWGVTCTPDGKWLCVAHSGTHELSVIDRGRLHLKLAAAASAGEAADVPNDLAFIHELRRRIRLKGNGPRGVAAAGSRVVVAEYFSGSLALVNLAADRPAVESFPLAQSPP